MDALILIGMPASGKSTIGVVLAKAACRGFIDTDLLIQETTGQSLQSIIEREGMERFLMWEEQAVLTVPRSDAVVATGGSVVYSAPAMRHLKELGKVIYLKWELPVLLQRLGNIRTRGIAMTPGKTIAELYELRRPLYERYADLTIECDGMDVEAIVESILRAVG